MWAVFLWAKLLSYGQPQGGPSSSISRGTWKWIWVITHLPPCLAIHLIWWCCHANHINWNNVSPTYCKIDIQGNTVWLIESTHSKMSGFRWSLRGGHWLFLVLLTMSAIRKEGIPRWDFLVNLNRKAFLTLKAHQWHHVEVVLIELRVILRWHFQDKKFKLLLMIDIDSSRL